MLLEANDDKHQMTEDVMNNVIKLLKNIKIKYPVNIMDDTDIEKEIDKYLEFSDGMLLEDLKNLIDDVVTEFPESKKAKVFYGDTNLRMVNARYDVKNKRFEISNWKGDN